MNTTTTENVTKSMRARRTPKVTRRDNPTAAKAGRERRTPKTPRQARSLDDLCGMPRDNVSLRGFWMLTDGVNVTVTRQSVGYSPTASITVPRAIFDAFADWYTTGVWKP